jgi:hypothetical protein
VRLPQLRVLEVLRRKNQLLPYAFWGNERRPLKMQFSKWLRSQGGADRRLWHKCLPKYEAFFTRERVIIVHKSPLDTGYSSRYPRTWEWSPLQHQFLWYCRQGYCCRPLSAIWQDDSAMVPSFIRNCSAETAWKRASVRDILWFQNDGAPAHWGICPAVPKCDKCRKVYWTCREGCMASSVDRTQRDWIYPLGTPEGTRSSCPGLPAPENVLQPWN